MVSEARVIVQSPSQAVAYLRRRGYSVSIRGYTMYASDRTCRVVYQCRRSHRGEFLWYRASGALIGDAVALVVVEEQVNLRDAIDKMPVQYFREAAEPSLVEDSSIEVIDAGRRRLFRAGFGLMSVTNAEAQGVLAYAHQGFRFLGRDSKFGIRSAFRVNGRELTQSSSAVAPVERSDLRYPPILRGHPGALWIVRNGLESLALWTLYELGGHRFPTMIVAAGEAGMDYLRSSRVQSIVRSASTIVVVCHQCTVPNSDHRPGARYQREKAIIETISSNRADINLWISTETRSILKTLRRRRAALSRISTKSNEPKKALSREAAP